MIYLQFVLAFAKRYWRALVVSAILVGIALFVMSWHNRGLRAEAAEANAKVATELARKWHDVAQECSAGVIALEAANKKLETDLATALANPPETIIRYRDRVQVIHDTVLSDDCPTAVAQIADLLAGAGYCEATP